MRNSLGVFSTLLICVFLLFNSCNKCQEKEVGEYHFTSEELSINPYRGHEILRFKNLTGDSVSLIVGDRSSDMIKFFPNMYVDEGQCNGNYTLVETNNNVISSKTDSMQFSIFLRFFPEPSAPGYYKSIRFEAKIPEQNKTSISAVTLIFGQDTIKGYNYGGYPYEELIYHKSLILGTKTFVNLYEFEVILQGEARINWVNKMYYSIKQGIVGFSTHQNELWYLEK